MRPCGCVWIYDGGPHDEDRCEDSLEVGYEEYLVLFGGILGACLLLTMGDKLLDSFPLPDSGCGITHPSVGWDS